MPRYTQHIGPPYTPFRGMNTRARRQQLAPSEFYGLRNVELSEGAIASRPGIARLLVGARTAKSLSFTTITGSSQYATLATHADYGLSPYWTVFVAYKIDGVAVNDVVAQMGTSNCPFRLLHNGGVVTAELYNGSGTTTLSSSSLFAQPGALLEVQLVRNAGAVTLYVNGTSRATAAFTPSTYTTAQEAIHIASYSGASTGFKATYYEFRLFREAMTSQYWRHTQYPWSGKFGDPNLACHLTFEDGSGASITDHSRNGNNATITGSPTWNSATARQVVTPITGIQVMENARGRKWLLVESGPNHYRIPLN